MKALIYPILLLLLLISGFTYSQDSTATRVTGADEVSISCAGSCGCSLEGVLSGEESYVQCSCNECTMEITITESSLQGGTTNTFYLSGGATMEIPLLEEYLDFEDASGETWILQKLTIYRNGGDEAVLFEYQDASGESHTVMFAKAAGKTYRISCEGECGCREVYSFETNSASCSCEDCVMTVEEVSNQ